MPTVVPLMVVIGLRERPQGGREADHPNWGLVTPPATGQLSGTGRFAEDFTLGSWHYDKRSGHDDDDGVTSPLGTQRGVRLVTPAFAAAALAVFSGPPYNMRVLTEAEWETFYDNRVRGHMQDNRVDMEVLNALKAEFDLRTAAGLPTIAVRARIIKALDPDDTEPGIRRDPLRRWATFKTTYNLVIPV